jgi:hypothetical protein
VRAFVGDMGTPAGSRSTGERCARTAAFLPVTVRITFWPGVVGLHLMTTHLSDEKEPMYTLNRLLPLASWCSSPADVTSAETCPAGVLVTAMTAGLVSALSG